MSTSQPANNPSSRSTLSALAFAAIIAESCPVPHADTLYAIGANINIVFATNQRPSYRDRLAANWIEEMPAKIGEAFPAILMRRVLGVKRT